MTPYTYFPQPPSPDSALVIDFPVLLDVETPPLSELRLRDGGRLVFAPEAKEPFSHAKLTSALVAVEDGGSLEIGSEECPFQAEAEILLTG